MKVLVQWALAVPEDWQVIEASAWSSLPVKSEPVGGEVIDTLPGWIAAVSCQGMVFKGFDHYAALALPADACALACWNDDPVDWPAGERAGIIHTFRPLSPDANLGGAINTAQTRVIHASGPARTRLDSNAPTDSFKAWNQFPKPLANLIRHGIWMSDELFAQHTAVRSRIGWADPPWTDHLARSEVDANGKLLPQRPQGRFKQ